MQLGCSYGSRVLRMIRFLVSYRPLARHNHENFHTRGQTASSFDFDKTFDWLCINHPR